MNSDFDELGNKNEEAKEILDNLANKFNRDYVVRMRNHYYGEGNWRDKDFGYVITEKKSLWKKITSWFRWQQ